MNAMLHDIEGQILLADTLSNQGKALRDFDLVLTNPPFGTKKGGERATRDDFTFPTSNKQLNFLQHIYRSLKTNGRPGPPWCCRTMCCLPTVTARRSAAT